MATDVFTKKLHKIIKQSFKDVFALYPIRIECSGSGHSPTAAASRKPYVVERSSGSAAVATTAEFIDNGSRPAEWQRVYQRRAKSTARRARVRRRVGKSGISVCMGVKTNQPWWGRISHKNRQRRGTWRRISFSARARARVFWVHVV